MKITKKLEMEILQVMEDYWNSYLGGDLQTWASYLPNDYRNIGTTKAEIWNSKKEIVDFTERVLDQTVGMAELRNKKTQIIPYAPYIMVHELGDLYVKAAEGWVYYAQTRLSSLLEKTTDGWKILHQHGSYPDSKTEEGEAFAFDEIKAENKKLRDAINSRTIELEQKNRELEIETSLERVRAQTMAMHNSEDVGKCIVRMYSELTALGVDEDTRFGIGILNHDNENNQLWTASKDGEDVKMHIGNLDMTWHPLLKSARKAWKKQVPLHKYILEGEDLLNYYQMLNNAPEYPIRIAIEKLPEREFHYGFVFDHGFFYAFCPREFKPDLIHITQRFSSQFGQTYRRYLDLVKAEAQAREAQIEAALERVRASSMAMHSSEELGAVAKVMFDQMKMLGGELFAFGIVLCDKHENMVEQWHSLGEAGMMTPFHVPIDLDYIHRYRYDQWKAGEELFSIEIPSDYIARHFDLMFELPSVQAVKEDLAAKGIEVAPPPWEIDYGASFKNGYLLVSSLVPYNEEKIFPRFAKVFEQAYTRFLDLQKAEAQAREAQIEAALERVRAKSMAMHESEELADLSLELVNQVQKLGVETWFCAFNIYDDDEKGSLEWGSNGQGVFPKYRTPREGIFLRYYEAGQSGETLLIYEIGEEECPAHYEYLCSLPGVGEQLLKMKAEGLSFPTSQIDHVAYFKYGYVLFITFDPAPEAHDVFKRFAKVFEQTYTRFLDLQKAEAQAREAQIEVAVERVRAEAMAMHSTSDFEKVTRQLLEQVKKLNLEGFTGAIIMLIDEDEFFTVYDFSSPGNIANPKNQSVRYDANKYAVNGVYPLSAWKKGEPYFVLDFNLEKLQFAIKEWEDINVNIANSFKEAITGGHLKHQWDACGRLSNGILGFDMIQPPDDDVRKITVKMTHAFEQAYTRFLDLQKAEAQAREAQIEAALERIRSKSLAMHKTDDLGAVVQVLFEEMQGLSVEMGFGSVSIYIFSEGTRDMAQWLALPDGVKFLHVPYFEHPILSELHEAKERSDDFFTKIFPVAQKNSWTEKGFELTDYKYLPEAFKAAILKAPGYSLTMTLAKNSGIAIPNFNGKLLSEEDNKILKRVGRVFEQTYTRFLDLQTAEAQAREAHIEAALERVRARTMAMQQSAELQETAALMFDQIESLNVNIMGCGFNIWNDDRSEATAWMSGMDRFQPPFQTSSSEDIFQRIYTAMENGESLFVEEQAGEELEEHYKYMASIPTFKKILEQLASKGLSAPSFQIMHCGYFSHGYLMFITLEHCPDAHEIFKRFANVFEQTYTRFLDLKTAEAQAREAQIEAALERVRARTMGMQKSEELEEVIKVLYDQFIQLKIFIEHTGFMLDYKNRDDMLIWLADQNAIQPQITIPYFDSPHWNSFLEAKAKGNNFFANHLDFEAKNKFYKELFTHIPDLSEEVKEHYLNCPGLAISTVLIDDIGLYIENFSGIPYTDEENNILLRFGKVFQQSYTRFLDLQKAEEQALEAQIEAALERVRSRSMGMQKSEELKEVIQIIFDQLALLKINSEHAGIVIDYKAKKDWNFWVAEQQDIPSRITVPYLNSVWDRQFTEAKEKGMDFFATQLNFEEKNRFYEELLKHIPGLTKKARDFYFSCPGLAGSTVIQKDVGLYIENFTGTPYSDDENVILKRFAKVLQQTYTRFLDLQKAEAQARENEIQLALERVRARAMAMQKSDELSELVDTVFKELTKLDFALSWCIINIIDASSLSNIVWAANPNIDNAPDSYHMKFEDFTFHDEMMRGYKERATKFIYILEGIEKKDYDEYLFKDTEFRKVPEEAQAASRAMEKYVCSFTFSNFGGLQTVGEEPLSGENLDILSRFGKVFDLTYTRFNDLKQAEAQAREAQIEAAMERVRARAMAMHKPEELVEVAILLRKEMGLLGVEELETSSIYIHSETTGKTECWFSIQDHKNENNLISDHMTIDLNDTWVGRQMLAFYLSKNKKASILMQGANRTEWITYCAEQSDLFTIKGFYGDVIPERTYHLYKFSHGYMGAASPGNISEESWDLLKRATAVFSLAYTRFSDLQTAEAQAREAQIEAALERTRAQSMMMQHSDELNSTSNVFHEQLLQLGLPSEFSYVWLPDEENKTHLFWATWSENRNGTLSSRSKAVTNPLDKTEPYTAACYEMWESSQSVFVNRIKPEEVEDFFTAWSELLQDAQHMKTELFPKGMYYAEAYMKYGCFGINIRRPLDEAEQDVLHRFAIEFERTYTRFLDLKNAEAQSQKIKLVNQENERLLHSILPEQIAEQIRTGSKTIVQRFEQVSILFADIVGFTILSENASPAEVVDILNGLFSKFDDLTDHYHLEKIKTIGDAYMVAAGVPEINEDHAVTMFRFAQDMLKSLKEYNQFKNSQLNLRIGISSGPVVAGVIGKKKFAYDLWGDSVNTAARMEAYGRAGKIQVSPASYELLKKDFAFEKIPNLSIKGKGVMDVYLWTPLK